MSGQVTDSGTPQAAAAPTAHGLRLADQCHGPGRAAVRPYQLEREPGEGESRVHDLVQVGQVLVVGDVLAAAHHVDRVADAGRGVRGWAVDAERLDLTAHDPFPGRFAQSGEITQVPLVAGELVPRAGVEQHDVARPDLHGRVRLHPV